jgi:hypothetical protein
MYEDNSFIQKIKFFKNIFLFVNNRCNVRIILH